MSMKAVKSQNVLLLGIYFEFIKSERKVCVQPKGRWRPGFRTIVAVSK